MAFSFLGTSLISLNWGVLQKAGLPHADVISVTLLLMALYVIGILIAEVPVKNSVRDLRTQLDWTQADLAAKLGVSRQTINAIETEKYDPSLPLAFKIAKLFRKSVEEIFKA
jgi:putative transcriptional regulator